MMRKTEIRETAMRNNNWGDTLKQKQPILSSTSYKLKCHNSEEKSKTGIKREFHPIWKLNRFRKLKTYLN